MGTTIGLWSFSNKETSFYKIDSSRSQGVVEDVLGQSFGGVLVSDFYGGYNKIESQKQKCWAHFLRDLHDLKNKDPENKEIAEYSDQAKLFYNQGKSLQKEFEANKSIDKKLTKLLSETDRWISKNTIVLISRDSPRDCSNIVMKSILL